VVLSFKYRKEKYKDDWSYQPKIPITLECKGKQIQVVGMLDSGSDITIIPKEVAETLGIVEKTEQTEDIGSFGGDFKAFKVKLNIIISKGHETYTIRNITACALAKEIPDATVVIGRVPFFQYFLITFDEKNKRVSLKRIHS